MGHPIIPDIHQTLYLPLPSLWLFRFTEVFILQKELWSSDLSHIEGLER